MANAGGAWDNAKKIVETELRQKGHAAARRDRGWRYGRRSVQRHLVGGAEPDHQVHHAVWPAGRGTSGFAFEGPRHERQLFAFCLFLLVSFVSSIAPSTTCGSHTAVSPRCHVAAELVLSCIVDRNHEICPAVVAGSCCLLIPRCMVTGSPSGTILSVLGGIRKRRN